MPVTLTRYICFMLATSLYFHGFGQTPRCSSDLELSTANFAGIMKLDSTSIGGINGKILEFESGRRIEGACIEIIPLFEDDRQKILGAVTGYKN